MEDFGKSALEVALEITRQIQSLLVNASKDPPFHVLDEEGSTDLLVIAGEASGDEHAAHLIEELLYGFLTLKVVSMGGPRLQEAGSSALYDLTDHAVVGIFEILRNLSFFDG